MSPIDVKAATDNRDSLAKTLYSRMFDWLVDKVNTSIGQDPNAVSLVGVLDIYGEAIPYPAVHRPPTKANLPYINGVKNAVYVQGLHASLPWPSDSNCIMP